MTNISQTQAGFKAKSRRNPLWIPRLFHAKASCVCRNRLNFRLFRYAPGYREWFHQTRREKKKRQGTYTLYRRRSGESDLLTADGCEACLQIGNDIIDVLGADGQADGVLVDLLLGQLGIGQLAVGGGGRVDNKALHVRHVGQQREDLQVVDEGKGFLAAALDVKGKDGCAAVGEILLVQSVIRMIRQRGVVHLFHLRVVGKELHHLFWGRW